MRTRSSDAFFLIRERLDAGHVDALGERLRAVHGVRSVVVPREASRLVPGHLIMVGYDPERIACDGILRELTSRGLDATLIDG